MIDIVINDQSLDLPANISLNMTYESPMFSDSLGNRAFSFSFDLPLTPRNRNIIKHQNRLQNRFDKTSYKAKIYHYSILFQNGYIELKQSSDQFVKCFFKNEFYVFSKRFETITLQKIDFGLVEIWSEQEDLTLTLEQKINKWHDHMMAIANEEPEKGIYKFPPGELSYKNIPSPTEGDELLEGTNEVYHDGLVTGLSIEDSGSNNTTGFNFPTTGGTGTGLTVDILANNDGEITAVTVNNPGKDYSLNDLVNLPAPLAGSGVFKVTSIVNNQFFGLELAMDDLFQVSFAINGSVNGFFENSYLKNERIHKDHRFANQWLFTIMPWMRADFILNKLAEQFGLIIERNDLSTNISWLRTIIPSGKVLDKVEEEGNYTANVHGRKIVFNEYMPDVTVIDFFEWMKYQFGVNVFITENYISIIANNEIILKEKDFSTFSSDPFLKKLTEQSNKNINISYDYSFVNEDWANGSLTMEEYMKDIANGMLNDIFIDNQEEDTINVQIKNMPSKTNIFGTFVFACKNLQEHENFWLNNGSVIGTTQFNYAVKEWSADVQYFKIFSNERKEDGEYLKLIHPTMYHGMAETYRTSDLSATSTICVSSLNNFENQNNFHISELVPSASQSIVDLFLANPANRWTISHLFYNEKEGEINMHNQGTYNKYTKNTILFDQDGQEIEKTLYLPSHVIKRIATFKEPVHVINSIKSKFKGIVASFSFTLSNNKVSQVKFNYKSRKL